MPEKEGRGTAGQRDSVRGSPGNPATNLQRPTLNHLPSLTQPHGSAHTRISARAFVHILEPLTLLTYSQTHLHSHTHTQLKYTPSQPLPPRHTRAPSRSCVYTLVHTHTHSQGRSGAVSPPQAPVLPSRHSQARLGPQPLHPSEQRHCLQHPLCRLPSQSSPTVPGRLIPAL